MRILVAASMSLIVAACSFASLSGFAGGGDEDAGVAPGEGGATDAPPSSDASTDANADGPIVPTSGWQFAKKLTIGESVVSGTEDLVDFPVLFATVDDDLRPSAVGGKLLTGKDLAFFDEGGKPLAFEVEAYEAATGRLIAWIKIPLLSPSAGARFRLQIGNPTVTQTLENRPGVWTQDFVGVWHMADSTWRNSVTGSTGSPSGSPSLLESGKIGAAVAIGSTSSNIDVGNASALQPTSITVSAWANPNTVGTAPDRHPYMIAQDEYNDTTPRGFYMEIYRTQTNPRPTFYTGTTGGIAHAFATTSTVNGVWYHVTGTRDDQTGVTRIYVNGIEEGSASANGSLAYVTGKTVRIGGIDFQSWGGLLDEVRIVKSARKAGWIATEHRNQSNPATFVTVGALEPQAM